MIRFLIALVLACLAGAASARQDPKVTAELEATDTVVGQPLILRITILVPTWMPKAPVFPNIEMPGLLVRLPQRAGGPVSETIDGETWSGVQNAYRLYPLREGEFTLPGGKIELSYADPGQPAPIAYSVALPPISFAATLPEGARDLSPLILAQDFTLTQSLEGETDLTAGDAVTRTVTANIQGTTAVMIPRLIPDPVTDVLRAYPKDPVVNETEDRGDLSGDRVETVSYVAQENGTALLPEITFDWYNLTSGKVETARLAATPVTVTGSATATTPPVTAKTLALLAACIVVAALIAWLVLRYLRPRMGAYLAQLRRDREASEPAARRRVLRALRDRNLSATLLTLSHWLRFFPDASTEQQAQMRDALARLGAARYGTAPDAAPELWTDATRAFCELRSQLKNQTRRQQTSGCLPPLNPVS
ncbi:BatD family protein [Rhodobacteraceae bacterium F11138]|nr:BatD family protein [Rhodobacteraceae bacterium F11138]